MLAPVSVFVTVSGANANSFPSFTDSVAFDKSPSFTGISTFATNGTFNVKFEPFEASLFAAVIRASFTASSAPTKATGLAATNTLKAAPVRLNCFITIAPLYL